MKKIVLMIAFSLSLIANNMIGQESSCRVTKKGLHVFAVINHSRNAKILHRKLNESKMVIFGNIQLGTALMQQDIIVELDLPLRVLVYKDRNGKVIMNPLSHTEAPFAIKELYASLDLFKKLDEMEFEAKV